MSEYNGTECGADDYCENGVTPSGADSRGKETSAGTKGSHEYITH